MCVLVETNSEKIIQLPLMIVRGKRWSAADEFLWDMGKTTYQMIWNQGTQQFDVVTETTSGGLVQLPARPVSSNNYDPKYITEVSQVMDKPHINNGISYNTYVYTYADGSTHVENIYFSRGSYYSHLVIPERGVDTWRSSTSLFGPWSDSGPPPANATPPNNSGGSNQNQD